LRTGAFYATLGPEILDLDLTEAEVTTPQGEKRTVPKVTVRTSPAQSIVFKAQRSRGRRFQAPAGELLTQAEYQLAGNEKYVRMEITAPDGKKAWSNPLFFSRQP